MASASAAFTRQRLCLEFASLKHAAPEGVYVAPVPDEPLLWTGVMFVRKANSSAAPVQSHRQAASQLLCYAPSILSNRSKHTALHQTVDKGLHRFHLTDPPKGPYANAILRFRLRFPPDFPARPPVCALQTDVFHPLVTPLTTYTYSTRDTGGAATVSATDADRLPPGGLSLRHGFPEWFEDGSQTSSAGRETRTRDVKAAEILHYLRIVFDTEAVLDEAPLETAANSGAWHAWRSFRALQGAPPTGAVGGGSRASSPVGPVSPGVPREEGNSGASTPRQQPGGARRPGEWNWQGVWEDRVRKSIKNSLSEAVLFGGGEIEDVVAFSKMEGDVVREAVSWVEQPAGSGS